mgnify:CR=1 FL=1
MKFAEFSTYLSKLEATTKRLEMFDILSEAFSKIDSKEIAKAVYFVQEMLLPSFENVQLGVADRMVEKAISVAFNQPLEKIKEENKNLGDLGLVAEKYNKNRTESKLSILDVYNKLFDIAKISGEGSVDQKINEIADLLDKTTSIESKYIVRFMLGRLRLGVGEATIMEALSKAKTGDRNFKEKIERAFNICSDLGYVAQVLYSEGEKGVENFRVEVMKPIRPALAERLESAEEIIKKIGRCAIDQKFDGFRSQVHKDGSNVKVFSRNLEDITHFMPEIVEEVKKLPYKRLIFDSEALAYDEDTNTLYPFQITIQRKRKHNVEKVSEQYPLRLFAFDLMLINDEDLLNEPYIKRREKLEKLFKDNGRISKSNIIITDDPKEVEKFFNLTVGAGLEGIVAKKLDAPYSAGARNFNWIKMKRSYKSQLSDTIDVVILGYFKGKGLRASLGIGALLAGVYDEKSDTFKTIAKIGSGFSEDQFRQLHEALDDIKIDHKPARVDSLIEPDVWVNPKYVITVKADEITRSPVHTCGFENGMGYALRFPRAVSFIRSDKSVEDANTVKEIIEMFNNQKKVKLKG